MKQKIFFVVEGFLLTFLVMFLTSCGKNDQMSQKPVTTVPVTQLTPQDATLQSIFPATLRGQEDVEIKPRVDGNIEAVYVDEGAKVSKGQALFKIDSPSAINALEEAQANYNTAKLNVERMRPLAEKDIISNVNIEAYENAFASAKAALEQAKSTKGWTTLTSPVNGVVGTINYRLGSLVSSASILTTVANTTNIIAYFSMNEKELYSFLAGAKGDTKAEKIKNMPEVKLILSNGEEYEEKGRIQTISGVVDDVTGAVNIRASFPNKKGLLLSGSSAKVVVPEYMEDVLVVPQSATFYRQDKILAYKVISDSSTIVKQTLIEVKATPDGKNYVVLDGLDKGDKIVTEGILNLSDGQKIKIQ